MWDGYNHSFKWILNSVALFAYQLAKLIHQLLVTSITINTEVREGSCSHSAHCTAWPLWLHENVKSFWNLDQNYALYIRNNIFHGTFHSSILFVTAFLKILLLLVLKIQKIFAKTPEFFTKHASQLEKLLPGRHLCRFMKVWWMKKKKPTGDRIPSIAIGYALIDIIIAAGTPWTLNRHASIYHLARVSAAAPVA